MRTEFSVLLVDDHVVMRNGLRELLKKLEGLTVVGEASTGREAVEMAARLEPDIVVMDVRMPDLNGFDATRQVMAVNPKTKVLALSAQVDDKSAIAMLRAGAAGYVAKDCASEELVIAIQTVMRNKVYFNPAVIAYVSGEGNSRLPDNSAFAVLSPREREVLQLIAEGKATKQVAAHLNVRVKTAETHRRNIMEKLNVDSVAGLTKYAIREGLTDV